MLYGRWRNKIENVFGRKFNFVLSVEWVPKFTNLERGCFISGLI